MLRAWHDVELYRKGRKNEKIRFTISELKEFDGKEIRYELPYSILGKIIDKLKVSKNLESGMTRALQNLKQLVEKEPNTKTKNAR